MQKIMSECKNLQWRFNGDKWECTNCGTDHMRKEEPTKMSWEKECGCGANTLLGKDNKHHSFWCDLYKKP
jgi:hypothetical protein